MRNVILFSILVGLIVGMVGSIYDPFLELFAQGHMRNDIDYWRGTVDSKLTTTEEKLSIINNRLKGISDKIDGVCDDVVNIRIKAAESGGIYGGLSALIIYVAGVFAKSILAKRNNNKK